MSTRPRFLQLQTRRNTGAFSPRGEVFGIRQCVADAAVAANQSLRANSLQTGKNTGIFAQFLHFGGFETENSRLVSGDYQHNSLRD
jgi:hypothetical protein